MRSIGSDNRLRGCGARCSIGATQLLVSVVEVEEDFAHIAAMARMASGDVLGRDGARRMLAELCDELLDERVIGKCAYECRQRSCSVGGNEQATLRAAAESVELPAGKVAELLIAIDDEESRVRLWQRRPQIAGQASLTVVECDEMDTASGSLYRRLKRGQHGRFSAAMRADDRPLPVGGREFGYSGRRRLLVCKVERKRAGAGPARGERIAYARGRRAELAKVRRHIERFNLRVVSADV